MQSEISARVAQAITEAVFPGCVIGVFANGQKEVSAFGTVTYDKGSPKVTEDTVYDLASITKSIPTASLVLLLISEGKLTLEDQVRKFIPELQNHYDATIEDLLRYQVHGPRMSQLKYRTFEQIRTHIFEHGFDAPPGAYEYTNLPAYLLGVVIERVSGSTLSALAQRRFFEPLGMTSTSFFPSASDCAPTEIQNGETIQGVVHDESARVFSRARRSVGHAGLFSTAGDILNFLGALLTKPEYSLIAEGAAQGLGWEVNQEHFMGKFSSPKTFGKTGFTGTSMVVDRDKNVGFVILSNRTYPERPTDSSEINAFRSDIANLLLNV